MSDLAQRLVALFQTIHPLERIPRAGYLLRGVTDPESVAAHSHGVALLVMLVCDAHPDEFDAHRAVSMALVHDLAESKLMDIPLPTGEAHLRETKRDAELAITEELFKGFPSHLPDLQRELIDGKTPEARLVHAADKAQMMLRILCYEREGRGNLAEFWKHPRNFDDQGLPVMRDLFGAICAAAGHPRPS